VPPSVHRNLLDVLVALGLSGATGIVYWLIGAPAARQQSAAPHFVLLADALLHGRLWIDPARAAGLVDITPFGGRIYVAFPPLPALLMAPFVAIVGPTFNDALFTLVLGAANAGLAYLLARRLSRPGHAGPGLPLGRVLAVAIAALLALGTVHCYSSLMGRVWFTAHVVAVTCLLLYLLECAGRGRPLVAGGALAAALLARPPALFGGIFWLLLAQRRTPAWRSFVRQTSLFALPPAVAIGLLLAQNALRFGSPLDFGYRSMRVAPVLAPDLRRYGQFNTHFLGRNLRALLLAPPLVEWEQLAAWWRTLDGPADLRRRFTTPAARQPVPFPVRFDPWGTGLWAVSPAFVFALRRPRPQERRLALAAGLSTLLVAVPNVLYYNTGWYQFGYRFSLDFTPFLLVLVAMGLRRPLPGPWPAIFGLLLAVSVLSNLLGARWFLRLPPY
jgi:hypothetical protein